MDVRGNHGRAHVPQQDSIELQTRGTRHTAATSSVQGGDTARMDNINRIAHLLESKFPGGEEIRDILHQKATVLYDELHQTADDVQDVINKAHKLDRITSSLEGAANAIGYAISGVPGDLIGKGIAHGIGLEAGTPMHDFVTGMASGMTAVGFKAVFEKVVANSIKDTKWMQADMDALEPFMQEVMKRRDTVGNNLRQAALGGTGYNARNPVTGAISVGTQYLRENIPQDKPEGIMQGVLKTGYAINQTAGAGLTLAAGSLSGVIQNKYDHNHGPEYLFGRNDWQARYQALSGGQKHSGDKSRAALMKDAIATPKGWYQGARNLIAFKQVAEALALGGGLSVANLAKDGSRAGTIAAAIGDMPISPNDLLHNENFRALTEGVAQLANLPAAATAYLAQGVTGVTVDTLSNKLHNWRHQATESSDTSSASTSTSTESEVEDNVSSHSHDAPPAPAGTRADDHVSTHSTHDAPPAPAEAETAETASTHSTHEAPPAPAEAKAAETASTHSTHEATPAPAEAKAAETASTHSTREATPAPAEAKAEDAASTHSTREATPAPVEAKAAETTSTHSTREATPAPAEAKAAETASTHSTREATPAPAEAKAEDAASMHSTHEATPAPAEAKAAETASTHSTHEATPAPAEAEAAETASTRSAAKAPAGEETRASSRTGTPPQPHTPARAAGGENIDWQALARAQTTRGSQSASLRAASPGEEASASDSASVRSHWSGRLQDSPPPRTQQMRASDTHPWWTDFSNVSDARPRPENISPDERAALAAHIEREAEQMNERIGEMIPPPPPREE